MTESVGVNCCLREDFINLHHKILGDEKYFKTYHQLMLCQVVVCIKQCETILVSGIQHLLMGLGHPDMDCLPCEAAAT